MNHLIFTKTYNSVVSSKKEILRYAGCETVDENLSLLLNSCLNESKDIFSYKVCYCELFVQIEKDLCDFGVFSLKSKNLALNLKECKKVVLFGATIGVGIDRLITKYSHISPTKALLFQSIGSEQIESLCDIFCNDIKNQYDSEIVPRFSPGYGDLQIETQKLIFSILDCERKIGITLNSSLLMSPTKSVTAFVGIKEK